MKAAIKPIHNDADHEAALAEIERLWDAKPGSRDGERLEVLAILVDAYEKANHPILPPDPIEAIRFRLEQRGLERTALQPILGCTRGRVSEILGRRRSLTVAMMRALRRELEIPAETLLGVAEPRRGKRPAVASKKSSKRGAAPRTASRKSEPPVGRRQRAS